MKLTDKQEIFCSEYLIDLNGTKAAVRAGYSKNGASVRASELLGNSNIQTKIQQLKKERIERIEIDADNVLMQVHNIAFSKLTDIVSIETLTKEVTNKETGQKEEIEYQDIIIKDTSKLPSTVSGAIESIRQTKYGINIKMQNKSVALNTLMKHLGLFEQHNEQKKVEEKEKSYDWSKLSVEELVIMKNLSKKAKSNG